MRTVRSRSNLTQRRQDAKIGIENFAPSRLCVIPCLVATLSLLDWSDRIWDNFRRRLILKNSPLASAELDSPTGLRRPLA
jgi:hypothetical protein